MFHCVYMVLDGPRKCSHCFSNGNVKHLSAFSWERTGPCVRSVFYPFTHTDGWGIFKAIHRGLYVTHLSHQHLIIMVPV